MRTVAFHRHFVDATHCDLKQQGMSLLEVVFALGVFVIFGSVFLAVSEQLTLYIPVGDLAAKEEAPVPILLAERLASAMDRLVSVLEQPGADLDSIPLDPDGCSKNPLEFSSKTPDLVGIFSLDDLASNKSEFQLVDRYQFCLLKFDPKKQVEGQQRLYVLIAKPKDRTAAMLPVVRRIFCRPKPHCGLS